jgi:N-acetylglucosamine-6-phosphate deacetylase
MTSIASRLRLTLPFFWLRPMNRTPAVSSAVRFLALVLIDAGTDSCGFGSRLGDPLLSTTHIGVYQKTLLCGSDRQAINRLLTARRGLMRQVTIAPAGQGGTDALHRLYE